MVRTLLLAGGLALFLNLPAGAETREVRPAVPADEYVAVKVKGRLQLRPRLRVPLKPLVEQAILRKPPYDLLPPVWQITAAGKTFTLDFTGQGQLAVLAGKLNGTKVVVTGTLTPAGQIRVKSLRPAEAITKTVRVEVIAKLKWEQRFSTLEIARRFQRPYELCTVTVAGKTYELAFRTPEVRAAARLLDGRTVVLTGTLIEGAANPSLAGPYLLPRAHIVVDRVKAADPLN
jgi:hypothetical protein